MELEEKKISSEALYTGKIINVRKDKILSPKGECYREVVEHPGGVVILPFIDKKNIILIKQWRYPTEQALIELPAGKLEYGEEPFPAAKRELTEETGYEANTWEDLGYIYTTPGFCNEKLYLYKATDLKFKATNFDEFELIETITVPFSQALEMIKKKEIIDSKTICAILKSTL